MQIRVVSSNISFSSRSTRGAKAAFKVMTGDCLGQAGGGFGRALVASRRAAVLRSGGGAPQGAPSHSSAFWARIKAAAGAKARGSAQKRGFHFSEEVKEDR